MSKRSAEFPIEYTHQIMGKIAVYASPFKNGEKKFWNVELDFSERGIGVSTTIPGNAPKGFLETALVREVDHYSRSLASAVLA